jgi:hypothetical protein
MLVKRKPDYEYDENGVNFRIYYREDKVIVKAKHGEHMVIQYANELKDAIKKSKERLHKMKAPQ